MTDEKPVAEVDTISIPDELQQWDIWTVWDCEDKTPLAPWQTGHMYPADWGSSTTGDDRPETSFQQARAVADMRPDVIHQSWPFPGGELPEQVKPGVILPHEPPISPQPSLDPPLMFVDFDNVRDPETGEVSEELWDIIERLDAYTEVSRSGTGLHCYVRARLPEGVGKFICPLNDIGDIELYDHGRFTGGMWHHVKDTPHTVPERQDVVDKLILEYEDEAHRKRRLKGEKRADGGERHVERVLAEIRGEDVGNQSSTNPYFQIDVSQAADTGAFSSHRKQAPGHEYQGPHPKHGAQSGPSWDSDSSNFEVDPTDNCWYCHLHTVGGGPLHLIGVLEDVVSCDDAREVFEDPMKLLKTCLYARDEYAAGRLDDADPPYKALLAVAELADLSMEDPDDGRLGKDAWRLARIVFDDMDASDVPA
jgi:hypothetical protein